MLTRFKILFVIFFILSIGVIAYCQDNSTGDKFSTTNVMLTRITDTRMGTILEYFVGTELKLIYVPFDFYNNGTAVKVYIEQPSLTPQMNVIFKNLKPFKVKIYMPREASNLTYRFKEFLSDEEKEKFKAKDLVFDNY